MEIKYLKYTVDELIEDKKFIAWVLKGSNSKEWEQLQAGNTEFRNKVIKARETILMLIDTYDVLAEENVMELWQKVEQSYSLYHKKTRIIKLRKVGSWAAIFILLFTIGGLTFSYLNKQDSKYKFSDNTILSDIQDAKLVLSTGEEIRLEKDNSTIEVNNAEELCINNDSIINLQQRKSTDNTDIRMNEVVIPYGKKSELLLADGTKVWLNAGSKLAFPTKFSKKTREVYLEGEAYFEVAHNVNQSFIVKIADFGIKVLGTRFNVSAYSTDKDIQTVLLEGSVSISKPATMGLGRNEVTLKPNQKAQLNKQSKVVTISNEPDANYYIAWTEGWFCFSQQNLKEVFTKLERYYNVKFVFADNFYSDELISGKLDLKDSFDKVMVAINDITNIDYQIRDNTIYIDKKIEEMPMRN